ncbi:MAG: hypothetical protein RLO50_21860 [Azospirillaceae bacterium]
MGRARRDSTDAAHQRRSFPLNKREASLLADLGVLWLSEAKGSALSQVAAMTLVILRQQPRTLGLLDRSIGQQLVRRRTIWLRGRRERRVPEATPLLCLALVELDRAGLRPTLGALRLLARWIEARHESVFGDWSHRHLEFAFSPHVAFRWDDQMTFFSLLVRDYLEATASLRSGRTTLPFGTMLAGRAQLRAFDVLRRMEQGDSVEEICSDHDDLEEAMVVAAAIWARSRPRQGVSAFRGRR